MSKQTTFDDIATFTGLSKATVSRYFNHPDSLSNKTREKITRALENLNYTENKLAKGLASGKSEFIGIIIPNLYMNYYAEMLNIILSTYESHHYKFLVFLGRSKKEIEEKYLHELMSYQIEGLIVFSHTLPSQELASFNIPVVSIERESDMTDGISIDNFKGGQMAANYLISHGARHIIFVTNRIAEEYPAYQRLKGFCSYCESQGVVPVVYQKTMDRSYEGVKDALYEVFEEIERTIPENETKGIFVVNDTYANLFENFILQKYGTFPPTYQLIGFDGTRSSSEAPFPITTLSQPKELMVEKAIELLEKQISAKRGKKGSHKPEHIQLEPVLIERSTTPSLSSLSELDEETIHPE